MPVAELEVMQDGNPVNMVEEIADINQWDFDRSDTHEINMMITGLWSAYKLSLSWLEECEVLHLSCVFDLKVQPARELEVRRLISSINEQLLVGHFEAWFEEGGIVFRQGHLLSGGAMVNAEQLLNLISKALDACEQYFQAFQFVVWSGKPASEALAHSMFDTYGNA